jgi:hypothetical protein
MWTRSHFFAPLAVPEGTGRFGSGQEFELSANAKKRDRVFCDLAFEHTDQTLIFDVTPRACAWALAAHHSILMCARNEDAPDSPPVGANQFDQFAPIHLARPALNGAKSRARKSRFPEPIQADWGCQS